MPVFEKKGLAFRFAILGVLLTAAVVSWVALSLEWRIAAPPALWSQGAGLFAIHLVTLAGSLAWGWDLARRFKDTPNRPLEELVRGLSEAGSLAESSAHFASFAHQVIPDAWAVVYAFHPTLSLLEAQASCDPHGQLSLEPGLRLPNLVQKNGPPPDSDRLLTLPLEFQGRPLGLLALEFPQARSLPPRQLDLLQTGSPMAALAMECFVQRMLAAGQLEEAETQRRSMANDLHDTLAQNIGYLRLKLDQLTCQPLQVAEGELAQELARLHHTAEEAYEQVRSMLDELNPSSPIDLREALFKQAQSICQRDGLHLRTHQIGPPFPLPVAVRRQILYIAREALHNIEKHAQAGQVNMQLVWLENEMILKVTDDGIGFDSRQPAKAGHYGLWIMHYRAREVGGDLKITPSEEGRGTEVTLWIPRRPPDPETDPALHPADINYQGEI